MKYMVFNYQEIASSLLNQLSARERDIIARRFGLNNFQEKETLESIGENYGVTRERIRQIQEAGLFRLRKNIDDLEPAFNFFYHTLRSTGDLRREEPLLRVLGLEQQNYVFFLLSIGKPFERFSENQEFHPLWFTEKKSLALAKNVSESFEKFLKEAGHPLQAEDYKGEALSKISLPALFSYLEISKRVCQAPDGLWGLNYWPEINPKGAKDRAYLVLKRAKTPLHFATIASKLNKITFEGGCKKKNILMQTVHNELIRDNRFVLVGRGLYALREWGYEDGTVSEVISNILTKAGSLSEEDIAEKVLEKRIVKKSTILQNLRNKNKFLKGKQGEYTLIS